MKGKLNLISAILAFVCSINCVIESRWQEALLYLALVYAQIYIIELENEG